MRAKIEWPKEWGLDNKGWLNTQSDHLLVTEPRTTATWNVSLRNKGVTLAERCHLLGGPEVPARTLEDCKREIQAYYDANGKRPTHVHAKKWGNMNSWLRCQGSSLRQLCDEMGLHAYMNLGRTMEGCKQQIRSYFKANGARPTEKVSVEWRKMALWLQRQGTSLSRLCDEMGLPTLLNLERTKADCKREVRAYFKANGVRPTQRTSAEWGNWKHWLERQGTSLSRLCDEMGLPTIVNLERTMDDCEREVRAYFDANGKRPTLTTSAEWRKMYSWLRGRGTTLYQLCDEMGLPTLLNLERTVEGCKQEIQAYYDANGVRPSVGASVEWARWDCWLRGRSTSVSQLCDETGLPALKNLKRTMEDCTREIQAYFDANGTRPKRTSAEWGNWDGWLKRQGSSLPRYCDEMRLPKAKAKAA